ncbi:MAG: DMT family transporter [Clostridia bacterium]|nr:DMT family transporter [Clostridia bacterium]
MSEKKSIFQNPFIIMVTALLCCALWGSATPFIKTGYELILPWRGTPSTILFAGLRFTLAGIITVAIYSIGRKKFLYPKKENVPVIGYVACFQTVLQYIFFYIGLANTSGVKGTIASGSSAFFALLVAGVIFKMEKITFKKLMACVIGFAGIVLVNLDGLDLKMNFFGDGFVIFSAIASATSSVIIKKYSHREDPVIISGYQFFIGGLVMIAIGLLSGGHVQLPDLKAAGVLIYLAFLSAIAYSLWGVLLKFNPVSKVSIYSFMTPVFGVILSNIMLNEAGLVALLNLVLAMALVSLGIFMLNYKKD